MKLGILLSLLFLSLLGCQSPKEVSKKRSPSQIWPRQCSEDTQLTHLHRSIYELDKKELTTWMKPQEKVSGVTLVVHGLNLRPSKMRELSNILLEENQLVLRVSLLGHRGSLDEQKDLTWHKWLAHYHQAFCLAQRKSQELGVPLNSLSFSLGSLVTQGHIAAQNHNPFAKMILLAPATWIHWYGEIPSWFSFLGRGIGIPSKNLEDYRSQPTTSLAAYESMGEGREEVLFSEPSLFDVPTLILMDPEDELVSLKKIRKYKEEKGLHDWRIYPVTNKNHLHKKSFHHLIVDEKSLGHAQWQALRALVKKHLAGPSPAHQE